ncbi:MAG TPA: DUF697 domain-containing protein [Pseudomonadota bacterium]|nr:DUF697 domain-containing protein [Pseudomonadota bacterium]
MTTHATASDAQDTSDAGSAASAATSRADEARQIVKRNVYWAVGAGLVPIPVADFVAMTAVQVKMLKELTKLYHLRFFDDKAKKIVGALVAGTGSLAVAGMVARSFVKAVPIVGQAIGIVGVPVLSGALTQAVGNVFIMHFESGGTLLNFDVEKMRAHFQKELATAKETVKQAPADKKPAKHVQP